MRPPSHLRSHLFSNLVRFARALRGLGIDVTSTQIVTLADALGHVSIRDRDEFKAAARAILVHDRAHLARFDRAFDRFWTTPGRSARAPDLGDILQRTEREARHTIRAGTSEGRPGARVEDRPGGESDGGRADGALHGWSATERLRTKDFARLTAGERARVKSLIESRRWELPRRLARRRVAGDGPDLDLRRTLRRALQTGGHPLHLATRTRAWKRRPLVVLCDVSGSMEAYARILLQFVYAIGRGPGEVEAFVFGTRLTRITRQLADRDADHALARVSARVVDWDGGTRIGESLRRFNVDWSRRVTRRGAVVLVISDAWDRGDLDLLEREVARLHRSCHRLVWLNPLLGSPGYEPLTAGVRTVLPHVDDFLPIHDLESLEQLGRVLERLGDRSLRRPAS